METEAKILARHAKRVADAIVKAGVQTASQLSRSVLAEIQEAHRLDWVAWSERLKGKDPQKRIDKIEAVKERIRAQLVELEEGFAAAATDVEGEEEGKTTDAQTRGEDPGREATEEAVAS